MKEIEPLTPEEITAEQLSIIEWYLDESLTKNQKLQDENRQLLKALAAVKV